MTFYPIVGQAIDAPVPATTGMNYAYDQVDDDGFQLVMSDSVAKGMPYNLKLYLLSRRASSLLPVVF